MFFLLASLAPCAVGSQSPGSLAPARWGLAVLDLLHQQWGGQEQGGRGGGKAMLPPV